MRYFITSVILAMSSVALSGCMTDTEEPVAEGSQATTECQDGAPIVTRTQGFWQNHQCVVKGEATGTSLVPVTLGSSIDLNKAQSVYDYFNQPTKGNKQLILGHQLLAAKLNVGAFSIGGVPFADYNGDGVLETVGQLTDIADALMDSGSDADRVKMATILDKLNNAGDSEPLYFDPTCKGAAVAPPPQCQ